MNGSTPGASPIDRRYVWGGAAISNGEYTRNHCADNPAVFSRPVFAAAMPPVQGSLLANRRGVYAETFPCGPRHVERRRRINPDAIFIYACTVAEDVRSVRLHRLLRDSTIGVIAAMEPLRSRLSEERSAQLPER